MLTLYFSSLMSDFSQFEQIYFLMMDNHNDSQTFEYWEASYHLKQKFYFDYMSENMFLSN